MPFVSLSDLPPLDYIVIGGGTTGITTATRLSEDPSNTVLVIEAGGYHASVPEVNVPGLSGKTIFKPEYDWCFTTIPQKGMDGRVITQPRGKGLGGCSLINFLEMFRPSKVECDALEKVFGNEGWNWDSLDYYFKKSEKAIIPESVSEGGAEAIAAKPIPSSHGSDGPIIKSLPTMWTEPQVKFFDAVEALGIPRNFETSDGKNVGSMTAFCSINPKTATRSYSSNAYLDPNIDRPNLLVLTDTQVTKVLLVADSKTTHRAVGVELVRDGAFQSPQILELSGIGNPEILSKFGITCVINLPGVGENLRTFIHVRVRDAWIRSTHVTMYLTFLPNFVEDHIGVSTIAEIDGAEETFDALRDPQYLKKQEELYKQQRGLLARSPVPGYVFLPVEVLEREDAISSWKVHAHVDLEDHSSSIPALKSGLEKQFSLLKDLFTDKDQAQAELVQFLSHAFTPPLVPVEGKRYTSIICVLPHPLSRGTVHIDSSEPLIPPAIDPNYFANEGDLELLAHIVRFAVQLYSTPPLSNIVKAQLAPTDQILEDGIPAIKQYVRDKCVTVFHPVGTAAMLPKEDGGVVDSHLKVYGTSNLRVVDLSILPLQLSCHPQAMAYAIGEKAADIMKSE